MFTSNADEMVDSAGENNMLSSTKRDPVSIPALQVEQEGVESDFAAPEEQDLKANKDPLEEVNTVAEKLTAMDQTEVMIKNQFDDSNHQWVSLQPDTQKKVQIMDSAYEVQKYCRNAGEIKERIDEIDSMMNTDDSCQCLEQLQRKHEELERHLAALNDKINDLDETANRLKETHPKDAQNICYHLKEIFESWKTLNQKADNMKTKLLDSQNLQHFLSKSQALNSWAKMMMDGLSSDKLAKDVAEAKELLAAHQNLCVEIKGWNRTYMALQYFGQQLLESKHYGSDKVRDRMKELADNKEALTEICMVRRVKLNQSHGLQCFESKCKLAESWMTEIETTLRANIDGGGVESLLKKQWAINEAIDKQERQIEASQHFADQLIANNHYDADRIDEKKRELYQRWLKLKSDLLDNCAKVGEAQSNKQLSRDEDEVKPWAQENLKTIINESDIDPPNIQAKHQNKKSFEAEPTENTESIQNVIKMREKPDENQDCLGSEDSVRRHNLKPLEEWEHLTTKSREKHDKLEEASRQRMYTTTAIPETKDNENDLATMQSLNKKYQPLDLYLNAHEKSVKELHKQADISIEREILEEYSVKGKRQSVSDSYDKGYQLVTDSRGMLDEVNILHQFVRDMNNEEAWIDEKKLLMGCEDSGHDMTDVQNLRNEQKHMELELTSQEAHIHASHETGAKLEIESIPINTEIRNKLQGLSDNWNQLRDMMINRGQKLHEPLVYQNVSDVEDEAWKTREQQLPTWNRICNRLSTAQVMLPKLYIYFAILLSYIGFVSPLQMNASYTTSFRCGDGSYALITGDNLTMEFNYGYNYSEIQAFHLNTVDHFRQMFGYESADGQGFIKDTKKRLKSYAWTDTGIKLTVSDIDKGNDLGNYKGEVYIGGNYTEQSIKVREILDPPLEVNITIVNEVEETVPLERGFGKYIFNASAEPYSRVTCSGVVITWVSSTMGNRKTCKAKDERHSTVCPLTLKESEMTVDECIKLVAYAEQYGVRSENKTFTVCLYGTNEDSVSAEVPFKKVIVGLSIFFLLVVVIIVVIVVVYRKCKGKNQGSVNAQYRQASQGYRQPSGLKRMSSNLSTNIKACCSDAENEMSETLNQHDMVARVPEEIIPVCTSIL